MTEKRFTLRDPKVDGTIGCVEIADNGQWITYGEVVNLLNQQNADNKELKQKVDFYKDFQKDARELEKANMQLDILLKNNQLQYIDLEKENKQLKQDVKCHEERIAILSQLLDLADAIIDLSDDENTKEFWEKMTNNMDSKWEELNKKEAKRDYTSGGIYND